MSSRFSCTMTAAAVESVCGGGVVVLGVVDVNVYLKWLEGVGSFGIPDRPAPAPHTPRPDEEG